ncbi:capsular biosynthesis protein [Pseudomonas sp. BRG-100]|uniref:UDP-2-acetamido-2,6-beta-L-arabino-hexul-4-ose reductase n=1 Tax=Pseudomonas sp. BRG-100 TaxID=1524267 RepID=UPI0004E678B0|nr:NAD-dependent epimerase/dehydratase family protein [Pseudomonas sp. BRG-100]KFF43313.1 capsular biosynthesis protein [Pseudomonas sp. BRG-100]
MKVLITGANGFVGQNLTIHLSERKDIQVFRFSRDDDRQSLSEKVKHVDFIFHLAGVNRPKNVEEFKAGNTDLTRLLADAVIASGRKIPIIYTSSTQAEQDNAYGASKRGAEDILKQLASLHGSAVYLFRLPNVFGKWARPNYNSAVATFCYNIARGLPVKINDPSAKITLVYIDDVIKCFMDVMDGLETTSPFVEVNPQYQITVGDLSATLHAFHESRTTLITETVGTGLTRALYATYLSYFPPENFTYEVPKYGDPRGVFVEMLKTPNAGQFSYFTAHPGITRGGHYHHTKTEKFLVIRGNASFKFRNVVTGEFYELHTSGEKPVIVETVPGWTHDVTNIGQDEMIVMLWANEIFDRAQPDTYALAVGTA